MITWRHRWTNIEGSLEIFLFSPIQGSLIFQSTERKLVPSWKVLTLALIKLYFYTLWTHHEVLKQSCGKVSHVGWLNMSCHVSSPSLTKQETWKRGEILTWCASAKVIFSERCVCTSFFCSCDLWPQAHTHSQSSFCLDIWTPLVSKNMDPSGSLTFSLAHTVSKAGSKFSRQLLWPLRRGAASLLLWPEYSPYLRSIPYPRLTLCCKTQVCWSARTLRLVPTVTLKRLNLSVRLKCLRTPLTDYLRSV